MWNQISESLYSHVAGFIAKLNGSAVQIEDAQKARVILGLEDLAQIAQTAGYVLPTALVPSVLLANLKYTRFVESVVGAPGGDFTGGVWNTRLNSHLGGNLAGCSLHPVSKEITIPIGTYIAIGHAVAYGASTHQTWLKSADVSVSVLGSSAYCSIGQDDQSPSQILGAFQLSAPSPISFLHKSDQTSLTSGRGVNTGFLDIGNIFADLLLIKLPEAV